MGTWITSFSLHEPLFLWQFSFSRGIFPFLGISHQLCQPFRDRVLSFKIGTHFNYPDSPSSAILAWTSSFEAILLGTFPRMKLVTSLCTPNRSKAYLARNTNYFYHQRRWRCAFWFSISWTHYLEKYPRFKNQTSRLVATSIKEDLTLLPTVRPSARLVAHR